MSKYTNLKTAVIGVGNMGKNHARIYSQISNLIAISDVNKKIGRQLATQYDANYYPDYKQMVAKETIDAVSVVVPTQKHYQVTKFILMQSIPVLVEKPIAKSVSQAQQLLDLAKINQVYLQVGHVERFNPAIVKLKSLINQNKFGNIVNLTAIRVGINPPDVNRADITLDLSIHDIDVFNHLLNQSPTEVHINKMRIIKNNKADAAAIMLKYKNTSGLIQTNWITPIKMRKLFITGTHGFAEIDYIKQKLTMYNKLANLHHSGGFFNLVSSFEPTKKDVYISKKEPLKEELKFFLKNRYSQDYSIALWAKKALEIIYDNK